MIGRNDLGDPPDELANGRVSGFVDQVQPDSRANLRLTIVVAYTARLEQGDSPLPAIRL
jgi:hypothetical protein